MMDFELVQLLYNNGFNLKAHKTYVYLNSLHLKNNKEEDTLNPFLSFVRISNFLSKCALGVFGLVVSTLSTNLNKSNIIII